MCFRCDVVVRKACSLNHSLEMHRDRIKTATDQGHIALNQTIVKQGLFYWITIA